MRYRQRQEVHDRKIAQLRLLFAEELKNMKVYCFKRIQLRGYKNLALKLSEINKHHVNAVLEEYFSMCKMIYRIRSIVDYEWKHESARSTKQGASRFQRIIALYNQDFTFMKMNEIVRRSLANCFEGTDPTQQLLIEKKKIYKPKEAVKKKFG